MEKPHPRSAHASSHAPARNRRPALTWIAISLCTGFWILNSRGHATNLLPTGSGEADQSDAAAQGAFDWEQIEPSPSLEYIPCFGDFQCARLEVPLNWNSTTDHEQGGNKAAVAIIKLPAQVPVTDPRYGGAVLLNPGGPGESGIYQVITDGKGVQAVLDTPPSGSDEAEAKFFDIVSFDPRGVNNTTPGLQCFTNTRNQQTWMGSLPDYGVLWSSDSITGLEWARAAAMGASCSYGEDEKGILRHANTPQTVEDMLQIVEMEGQWRTNEASRLLAKTTMSESSKRQIFDRVAYHPGSEKIQYWGMSYGTIIGSTFAALHPDRIHRLVIDGVVDPADHYTGAWMTQLGDSDMIISKFCEYCFHAGSSCPLYDNSSAVAIENRLISILESLKYEPIPIALAADGPAGPDVVTYGDAHLLLLSAMYFPFASAEHFFNVLPALEDRDPSSSVLKDIVERKRSRRKSAACPSESPSDVPYVSGLGPFAAISCMDAGGTVDFTRAEFDVFAQHLQNESRWIGLSWARNKLACLGYTVKPEWRPELDFASGRWETSHPLLIIGNTHDTVTPLRNAQRVSTLFPGSVVLQQDSQGHCSHSTPTLCTAKTVRRYFQTGELPDPGTVCVPEMRPFVGCLKLGGGDCEFADAGDERLWESVVGLADPFGLRRD